MSQRPPRATTKGDGKRPKTRGSTAADKKPRAQSVDIQIMSTDAFEKIGDDEVVEETELPEIPQLQLLVHDGPPHLAAARGAIAVAGHLIVAGGSGAEDIERLRPIVGRVDAIIVGLPGGEPLIDVALGLAPRPVVIASCTGNAVDATRRAAAAGADLVTLRPHDTERLAPILLAAARLVEFQRRPSAPAVVVSFTTPATSAPTSSPLAPPEPGPLPQTRGVTEALDGLDLHDGPHDGHEPPELPELPEVAEAPEALESHDGLDSLDFDALDDADPDTAALQPYDVFESIVESELERAQHERSPIALALFAVDVLPPDPPPGISGILRARAGTALADAIREIGVATELDEERFLVLLPYTDRAAAAEIARRIITAVGACDPVTAGGKPYLPKLVGAVTGAKPEEPTSFAQLMQDATQLLEQTRVTGASLAVEP